MLEQLIFSQHRALKFLEALELGSYGGVYLVGAVC